MEREPPPEAISRLIGPVAAVRSSRQRRAPKAAVVGESGELLYTWYDNNNGDVLGTARKIMDDIYDHLPEGCAIGHVTTTGYGEGILIEAR